MNNSRRMFLKGCTAIAATTLIVAESKPTTDTEDKDKVVNDVVYGRFLMCDLCGGASWMDSYKDDCSKCNNVGMIWTEGW